MPRTWQSVRGSCAGGWEYLYVAQGYCNLPTINDHLYVRAFQATQFVRILELTHCTLPSPQLQGQLDSFFCLRFFPVPLCLRNTKLPAKVEGQMRLAGDISFHLRDYEALDAQQIRTRDNILCDSMQSDTIGGCTWLLSQCTYLSGLVGPLSLMSCSNCKT